MFITKRRTRRKYARVENASDDGYYTVNGSASVATPEEAADLAIDVWREEIKAAPQAPTLWDLYRDAM